MKQNITTSFKGWNLVSSIAIAISGQITLPQNQVFASPFIGVQTLNLISINDAKKITFPTASSFNEIIININDDILKKVAKKSGISKMTKDKETKVFQAINSNGENLGYFFIDKVYGKHELITYSVGIDTNGAIKHIEILEYKESYGGQVSNEAWRKQFIGKTIESKFELNNDIKNISGATLSCKHITDGVKRILSLYEISIRNKA
jgi:Na+-translocating ferredoxin:NAD+ oxidoreductase RnfG subunit